MSQMTLRKQLKEFPEFKAWFSRRPRPAPDASHTPEWALYVQKEKKGRWSRVLVSTYEEGHRYIAKHLGEHHDMALSHRRRMFQPPRGAPEAFGHSWCKFCRRLTVFRTFSSHHALSSWTNPTQRRCSICGARMEFAAAR